jgi:hypothetical protein
MVKRAAFLMSATGRLVVGIILITAASIISRMEIHGLQNVRRDAVTYLAISHKRDLDTFGPVFPVLWARGWRAFVRDVRFAMRGDAFAPHFLSRIVLHPRWLSWLLQPLSVGGLLRGIGLYPLHDLRIRPASEWVREHLDTGGDDALVGDAISTEFIQYLSANGKLSPDELGQQPLSSLLLWRYHAPMQVYWGSEIFTGSARRHAEQRLIARARRELDDIASWMQEGGSLYSSPEGKLSSDGTLSRISSGFHRMLRVAPEGTSVIPIAIIYDFMTTRRLHMFVEVMPPIADVTRLSRAELDHALQMAWRRGMRLTCTQVASGFLVKTAEANETSFTLGSLVHTIVRQAHELVAEGRLVDERLLFPREAEKLASSYLKFAERHRLIRRRGATSWKILNLQQAITVRPGDVGYPQAPITYAWNELQDMLQADTSVSAEAQESEKPESEIAG